VARRRFGVSIEEGLARRLDSLARALGRDRSSLVEEALRAFLEDHDHMAGEHACRGIIVAECGGAGRVPVDGYREVVASHIHAHMDGGCIELLLVDGDSSEIRRLYNDLLDKGCKARYVPLH